MTGVHTVRLTPKSLFFALVSLGLPFAVTIGWALGETTLTTPPAAATPNGSGGIGAAPKRTKPVSSVDYPERTAGVRAPSSPDPVVVRPRSAAASVEPPRPAPSVEASESGPSPSSSADPSTDPSSIDVARVIRRP